MPTDKQRIVVVGGGGAGSLLARSLSSKIDITKQSLTLVTARPFNVYLPGQCRTTVSDQGSLEKKTLFPYDRLFHNGKGTIRIATAKAIERNASTVGGAVVLEGGESIGYDVLVLAPGSVWEGPLAYPNDPEGVESHLSIWRTNFAESTHIVLAGGGAVGIEFAGEIKDIWPHKKVTIVHGNSALLNDTYPAKYRALLERQLLARGVEILYNDFVEEIPLPGPASITTRRGMQFDDALIVPTRGGRPNTDFIRSCLPNLLNDTGQIRVRPTLQTLDYPDIFAIGDCTDWNEQKQIGKYYSHVSVCAANVIGYLRQVKTMKVYKGSYEMIVITNGQNGGASYFGILWGFIFGNWVSKVLKSKHLLIGLSRRNVGL
ncbi:FAD/NAD(P)-binding domain-containing protein [Punctularia strigosozonata HHB-11173 SS5]|uniref:FAD/NAD(P)-binding domain-containing protein n=1 Tax=Punctularia strigosozonata (strain HHB-11173) TaxID=741275 RepID=R7S1F7_PUNST|nr:FAD/NAD(P)-binding domain-containing protein [Punctularia strigosozonata HHB-11173 SS5]EIN04058.1 FAD/NAD(P)-binding domain-containing protein [Punctularia strigosozonata HHB-11173 SS5]